MAEDEANLLRSTIARIYRVAPGQVVLGAGSTDLLRACAGLRLGPGKRLLTVEPGFAPIAQYARATGAEVENAPLDRAHRQDLAALAHRVTPATGLIYLSNPHNPTGTLLDHGALTRFLGALPPRVMVLIDEAYIEYAEWPGGVDPSMIRETAHDPRLVVTRTFSKIHGMAGLRAGYGFAAPSIARQIALCGPADGIGTTALRAASAAVADGGYTRLIAERNRDARQEFLNQANTRMLEPVDSQTNFVMLFIDDCLEVAAHFGRHNVLVAARFPGLAQSIRVTLGTPAQMAEFWRVLDLKRTLRPF
jgi:histidinol-phosphate aminotransferase